MLASISLSQDEPRLPPISEKEVTELAKSLGDWDDQYQIIQQAMVNMWDSNGWTSEADLAARDAALEIQRVPPWKMGDRIELLVDIFGDRYTFDQEQSKGFRKMMYKEAVRLGIKYGPMVMKSSKELLQTRLRGEPFTPDQIARLEKSFDPLLDDVLKDVDRITSNVEKMLTPEQLETWSRDMKSFKKRTKHFLAAREKWKEGGWEPAAWGLQNDPIHVAAESRAEVFGKAVAHDETTWHHHVTGFIRHYDLDAGQAAACRAMLDGSVAAASSYRKSKEDAIKKLPPIRLPIDPLLLPIRDGFAILQGRLDGIPTERQRRKAARRPTAPKTKPVETRKRGR
jgi:hypothetical protein